MSDRQEELLGLAEVLIEEHGLDSFGLGSLARAAGIRPPSLYKHFESLATLEHKLISRRLVHLARVLDAEAAAPHAPNMCALERFAHAYRNYAYRYPQLYRLMTERDLDRSKLVAGAEEAAMASLLQYFGESVESHDRARAVWAAAHGLISLELANRFPPGSDLDAAWAIVVDAFKQG